MKCYRFKHIPTGMYWRPSRTVRKLIKPTKDKTIWMMVKSNLSKKGKVYTDPPSWRWLKHGFYNHVLVQKMLESGRHHDSYYTKPFLSPFIQSEWELEVL
jgi:hypothetical protein